MIVFFRKKPAVLVPQEADDHLWHAAAGTAKVDDSCEASFKGINYKFWEAGAYAQVWPHGSHPLPDSDRDTFETTLAKPHLL